MGKLALTSLLTLSLVSEGIGNFVRGISASKESSASIAAREYHLSHFQTEVLHCIRQIENGPPGREYGVLHAAALDRGELTQARWAAGTIQKRLRTPSELSEFANRWAPPGADNDPGRLNEYWLGNMHACLGEKIG